MDTDNCNTMKKRKPIPKKTRELVWKKYGCKCGYCGCDLEYKDLVIDHMKSVFVGIQLECMDIEDLNSVDNLMPSCRMCNYYKGAMGIEGFRKQLKNTLSHTCVDSFQARLALKYGMIKKQEWDGKFWFEKFEETPQQ